MVGFRRNGYDVTKPWYDQPKNFARWYALKPPYDSIHVGCDPGDGMTKATADFYDAIVNVSSTKCATFAPSRPDQRTYWFPLIELGRWPIVYLLWLKEVLDFHYAKGHKVYLHCHAGAFRSPSTALLWLQSRGHTPEEALEIDGSKTAGTYRIQERQGNIHSLKDKLFEMFRAQEAEIAERGWGTLCIETICTYNLKALTDHEVLSGENRRRHILTKVFWFYFKPKWWIKGRLSEFRYWREGYGCVDNHYYQRKYFWSRMGGAEPHEDSRRVGAWSWDVQGKKWVEMERWNAKTLEFDVLIESCPVCEGRGRLYDKDKAPGQNYLGPCTACDRTGRKL